MTIPITTKIIQSQDFKCAFCKLNCTAHKVEITGKEVSYEVQVVHTMPACEEFLNMSAPDFMWAANKISSPT